MDIKEMERTPNPARGLQSVILSNYSAIANARQQLWGWAAIAEALGRPGQAVAVCKAFHRIDNQIQKGKLKVPKSSGRVQASTVQAESRARSLATGSQRPLPVDPSRKIPSAEAAVDELGADFFK